MKSKRNISLAILLIFIAGFKATGQERRPNIILVLTDDMGWMDSEPYGNTYYETPHLTRLANEGMLFTDAYAASPLCSPTRASIMSGQYPARLHITVAITARDIPDPRPLDPTPDQYCGNIPNKDHMDQEIYTIAEALRDSGYKTAHIGKWHLSPNPGRNGIKPQYNAENQGFDFVIGGDYLPGPPDYYSPYKNRIRNLEPGYEGEYLNERLAKEAVNWMDSVKETGKPFFLNFWNYAVHTPIVPKKDLLSKYRRKPLSLHRKETPEMATMLESMDNGLGIILDWLDLPENKSIKDNTIIVFTSDNGGVVHEVTVGDQKKQVTSNRPLRGGKANTYEGGVRVPFIVRWPNHIKAGAKCNTPISSLDIYPSFLELAGIVPKDSIVLDGRSILPLLNGEQLDNVPLFVDFPHHFGILCASSSSVRLGNYKLIRFYWAGKDARSHYYELFDLKNDIYESINLASYMPEKVSKMDALIEAHLEKTSSFEPIPNTNFKGDPRESRPDQQKSMRPESLSLSMNKLVTKSNTGSRKYQLSDNKGNTYETAALILEGSEWIQVVNLPDGQVEVSWDRKKKKGKGTVLFGWKGGTTVFEMNDWTLAPFQLTVK